MVTSTPIGNDDPLDTELARVLHKRKRVDLDTLQSLLGEARTRRDTGHNLAILLVERGLLREAEARQLVAELSEADSTLLNTLGSKHGATVDPWQAGARVGPYEILRRIGKGAMGMVFLARHLETGGRYAIKTIGADANELLLARMLREGEAQARVDGHPNVVRIHEQGEQAGRLYLVMELASGGDLEARMKGPDAPDFTEAAAIVAGLARGLAHMHELGVLHRDLKPGNVLFDEADTPKLVDFGLARFDGANSLTRTGEIVGTPLYMAPEQALGRHDLIGPKTDVYGLGAILYRLVTGALPYEGQTAIEVYHKVVSEPPDPPRSKNPDVPLPLEGICMRAMQREPERRFTAEELAAELEGYVQQARAGAGAKGSPRKLLVGLLITALLSVASAIAAVVVMRGERAAPEVAQASSEPTPTAEEAVQPNPSSAPSPQVVDPGPLHWRWTQGQERRIRLEVKGTGAFGQRGKITFHYTLMQRWTATAVAPERVDLDVTIDRLAIQWTMKGGMGDDGHDFDSQRASDKTERQSAVIGKTFQIVQDPRTGETLETKGVKAVGDLAQAGLTGWDRMRYRIPPFASDAGFKTILDAALHTFPTERNLERWSWPRPLPDALGFSAWGGDQGAGGAGGAGGSTNRRQRMRPPPIETAAFKLRPAPPGRPGVLVTWMGRARVKPPAFQYSGWTVTTTLKRDQMGRQQVIDGAVKSAEVNDSFTGTRQLVAGSKRRPPTENKGRTKISFQVLD